jgi:hypothetical protein
LHLIFLPKMLADERTKPVSFGPRYVAVASKSGSKAGMSAIEYKGYRIEPLETSAGRWQARVSRLDGQKIKIRVSGKEAASITTRGMPRFTMEAAIAMAEEMIDGPGMD